MSVTYERLRARIGLSKLKLIESCHDRVAHLAVSAVQSRAVADGYNSVEPLDAEKRGALLHLVLSADWHPDHRASIINIASGPTKLTEIPKPNRTKQQDYTN